MGNLDMGSLETRDRHNLLWAAVWLAILALLIVLKLHIAPMIEPLQPTPTLTETPTQTASATPTLSATPTPTGGAVATPTPEGGMQEGVREVPPVVYVMWDVQNLDYGRVYPALPPLGGVMSFEWDALYPEGVNVPDWSVIDRWIMQAQAYQVTLPDGQKVAKPVAFGVDAATMDDFGTLHFPDFVIEACGPASALAYTYDPDGEGPCPAYSVPNYSNTCWQAYWFDTIRAMGTHFDNNPQFHNLAWVKMNLGWDEEAVCWKKMGRYEGQACDYTGGPSAGFDAWVRQTIAAYHAAFPHLVNVAQMMHHATQPYGDWMATLPYGTTGIKLNGWEYDVEGARIYYGLDSPQLVGGWFGYGERWAGILPVGYEPAGTWTGGYWEWLNMLISHPDLVDMQLDLIRWTAETEQEIDFGVMEWGLRHLGVTVENSPDVWIAFRETSKPVEAWCAAPVAPYAADCERGDGSAGTYKSYEPVRGPFEFWLHAVRDRVTQSYYRMAHAGDLPAAARDHVYAQNGVARTDQAAGQPYILLDIADGYAVDDVAWLVTATVLNSGTDRLSLQYVTHSGQIVQQQVQKGAALGPVGQWVDVIWMLPNTRMDGELPGQADFRIDCLGDGDEYVHRIIVSRYKPVLEGKATWYGEEYIGQTMRNGEVYTAQEYTAAVSADHWPALAGKHLLVCTSTSCVEAEVTDSGDPEEFARLGVAVDLSPAAFMWLGDLDLGVVDVKVYVAN